MVKSSSRAVKGKLRQIKKQHKRTVSAEQRAWKNANLTVIREGTPTQVREAYKKSVKDGDIVFEKISQETEIDPKNHLTFDSELKIIDEDEPNVYDTWQNRQRRNYQKVVFPGSKDLAESEDSNPFLKCDRFELIVDEDYCTLSLPNWRGCFRGVNSKGNSEIFEGICRIEVFKAIAKWLETERAEFLKDKDGSWLNLGPKDYKEVTSKQVTVVQDSFLDFLKKESKIIIEIDKSVFSRYLNACQIVWPDGSMPVKELFSEEARKGWVAKSIMVFMQNRKYNDTKILHEHKIKIPKVKKEKQKELRKSIDPMDINEFIIYANLSAQTSWDKVQNTYFKKVSTQ